MSGQQLTERLCQSCRRGTLVTLTPEEEGNLRAERPGIATGKIVGCDECKYFEVEFEEDFI